MQDRPDASDILDSVADFLMKEIMPAVKDNEMLAYKTLVSWNMLGVLSREWKEEDAYTCSQLARLESILESGFPEEMPVLKRKREALLLELNAKLCEKIRHERIHDIKSNVWSHVKQSLIEQLAVANPRFNTENS